MTYDQFDHAMMYFWFAYFPILFVGLIWAAWAIWWDEPRRLKRERQSRPDA